MMMMITTVVILTLSFILLLSLECLECDACFLEKKKVAAFLVNICFT